MTKKLSEKHRKFADEYLKCGNAYRAALNAEYSENYAKAQSHKLLENVGIKNYIEKAQKEMRKETIATGQEVLEFLTQVMKAEVQETETLIVGENEVTKNKAPRISDRLKSAEMLGKHYSLFTDRQQDADMTVTNSIVDALIKKAGGVIESD